MLSLAEIKRTDFLSCRVSYQLRKCKMIEKTNTNTEALHKYADSNACDPSPVRYKGLHSRRLDIDCYPTCSAFIPIVYFASCQLVLSSLATVDIRINLASNSRMSVRVCFTMSLCEEGRWTILDQIKPAAKLIAFDEGRRHRFSGLQMFQSNYGMYLLFLFDHKRLGQWNK